MADQNNAIVGEVLQKILALIAEYASEQAGVANILSATEDEITDATRDFLNGSDDLRADILSRQRVLNSIGDILNKIDDIFPDEATGFVSLSSECTTVGCNELLTKALVDDFWAKNE